MVTIEIFHNLKIEFTDIKGSRLLMKLVKE